MSMTIILLTASIVCNVWFLILLLHDRIMDTRVVRFLKGIAGLWKSLQPVEKEAPVKAERQPAGTTDVIGKSRFKMPPTRTTAAIPTPQAATSEKGEEVSSDDVTFDDENGKTQPSEPPHPVQIPDEKLDETFTSIPPEELEFGEDEPEEESPERPQASGSSFDEIDDAVKTAKNPETTETEQTRAAKVFSDMEGTELYEKLMAGSTEMSIRIKGLIEIRLKKPKKEFVIPDNIEEFDIRKYV